MLQRICRLTFEPIDEEIEVLHGKDRLCLLVHNITVIGMNALRRTLLPCRHAKNFPRLLAKTYRKKLLEVTWKPHKHDFSRPCTHIIVPIPICAIRHSSCCTDIFHDGNRKETAATRGCSAALSHILSSNIF